MAPTTTIRNKVMTAYTDVESAQKYARLLEGREAKRLGVPVSHARPRVAERVKSSPGFLKNLRNNRLKNVPSWLMQNLREAFVAELNQEIRRLEHEIHLARQTGAGPGDDEILAAQAQVEAAKKLLNGK